MQVNTKTGQCKLTKREQQTLADAKALLLQIAKHGEGRLTESADFAADKIGEVQQVLNNEVVVEPVG